MSLDGLHCKYLGKAGASVVLQTTADERPRRGRIVAVWIVRSGALSRANCSVLLVSIGCVYVGYTASIGAKPVHL